MLWYVWTKLWTYLAPILTLSPNRPKRDSTWPTPPRSSNGCVQNDFWAYGTFGANYAPTLNQDYHYIQTDRNKLPFEPRHLGVPSTASKTIFCGYSTFDANRAPILHWNLHYLQMDRNELSFEPRQPGVSSGASKTISDPMVRLAQIVHLSCMKTNTTSKRTERRFYRTHVTLEFHRVRPKWFLRLWYVWCKLWIYLAPRLTLYPNGPKWDSTWPTSPRSSIESVQNDFRAYGTFGANRAPMLHWN
jgi:hypothetical protein